MANLAANGVRVSVAQRTKAHAGYGEPGWAYRGEWRTAVAIPGMTLGLSMEELIETKTERLGPEHGARRTLFGEWPTRTSYSRGHHIGRHADGGPTTPENQAEVCIDCHKELHSP
jgi:hypothetical protein